MIMNTNDFILLSDDEKIDALLEKENDKSQENILFLYQVIENKNLTDLVRIAAIKSIGLIALDSKKDDGKGIVDFLIKTAKEDHDDDVRVYTLRALQWLSSYEEIPVEISSILNNEQEDENVRFSAFNILISQKENPMSKSLLDALKTDALLGKSAIRELNS
jgi:HEAT repeat protein